MIVFFFLLHGLVPDNEYQYYAQGSRSTVMFDSIFEKLTVALDAVFNYKCRFCVVCCRYI